MHQLGPAAAVMAEHIAFGASGPCEADDRGVSFSLYCMLYKHAGDGF